jgi:hypothetical protein
MNAIQQSTASMNDTRRKMLIGLLKKRYEHQQVPDYFIEQEVDYYLAQLKDGKPLMSLRPQEEQTDAEAINQEMLEYEIDIHTIYQQLDHVSQRLSQHQKLNESVLNDVRMRVQKVDERLEELGHILRNDSAHSVFYETFLDYKSKEKDDRFYTDRDGRTFAPAYHLTLDAYQHSLKLPTLYTENKLVNFAGVKLAKVNITKQLGSGFIRTKNPEHGVDKAIDTAMSTYWQETILADEPLEVNLGLDYYGVDFGATCELEIDFDYISKVNEITLSPFTEYPLEVVSILVYTTDSDEEKPFELVSPTAIRRNLQSTDVMSYQFQDVVAKRIKILLNQQHYVKQDLLVNVDDKTLIDAWLKNHDHIEVEETKLFKPIYQDQHEMYPQWANAQVYLKEHNVIEEIERYEDMDPENKIHLSKYEYQYGLYNIAVNNNEYFHDGVFVTEPLISSNVHIATLDVDEEHPILEEIKMPVTSIEYYMTDAENPTPDDWFPVLPQNTKEVISERLYFEFMDGSYQSKTRFGVDFLNAIRKNGDPLLAHDDYRISGRTVMVTSYDPSAIYTADYRPLPESYQVDFLKRYTVEEFNTELNRTEYKVKAKKCIEEFKELEGGSQATLSYYPFVDKDLLNQQEFTWNPTYLANAYMPFRVRLLLPDGSYVDQRTDQWDTTNAVITNRTDYFDQNRSLLEPFTGENYQYRIERNLLKFNTKLPEGTRIHVEYPYLTGPIRLKMIMRRNLNDVEGLTPFLHEFKAGFQTLT